jgi:multicomponent Na+:H+ antiporter subunit E
MMQLTRAYSKKIFWFLYFLVYVIKDLIISNFIVAYYILVVPSRKLKPGVVAVPLEQGSDLQLVLLSNVISLSPGTLSIDLSDDKKFLFVHSMFCQYPEIFIKETKKNFERPIIGMMQ